VLHVSNLQAYILCRSLSSSSNSPTNGLIKRAAAGQVCLHVGASHGRQRLQNIPVQHAQRECTARTQAGLSRASPRRFCTTSRRRRRSSTVSRPGRLVARVREDLLHEVFSQSQGRRMARRSSPDPTDLRPAPLMRGEASRARRAMLAFPLLSWVK
jgi:hypothetical protein